MGNWTLSAWPILASAALKSTLVLGVAQNSPWASKVTVGSIVTSIAGKPLREIQDLQTVLNDTSPENCNIEVVHGSEPQVASMSAAGQ